MEDRSEVQNITNAVAAAMRLSTDSVTAAGAENIASLALANIDEAMQLARCIAAFTTDDALADEMGDVVDESPAFLISKVMAVRTALEEFTGKQADLEKRIWMLVYAGRRERSRVMQTLARRSVL